jgi:hypothetical protein
MPDKCQSSIARINESFDATIALSCHAMRYGNVAQWTAMKRFCALLLVLILPLQFSAVAAAVCCADEPPATVAHLGHLDQDSTSSADAGDSDEGATGAIEVECGICHLGWAKLPTAVLSLHTPMPTLPIDVAPLLCAAQHKTDPLQRPPIASLA